MRTRAPLMRTRAPARARLRGLMSVCVPGSGRGRAGVTVRICAGMCARVRRRRAGWSESRLRELYHSTRARAAAVRGDSPRNIYHAALTAAARAFFAAVLLRRSIRITAFGQEKAMWFINPS